MLFWLQNVSNDSFFLLRIHDDKGGPGNPSAPIDVNAFRTTNFRSWSDMRGAKFHGNTRGDGPTRICSTLLVLSDLRVLPSEKKDVSKGPSRYFLRGLFLLRGAHTIHIPKSRKNIYGNSFSMLK